jgi:hypothetical protein
VAGLLSMVGKQQINNGETWGVLVVGVIEKGGRRLLLFFLFIHYFKI